MNTFLRIIFLFPLFSLAMSSAFAGAPVWKISNGDDHLYLGGTLHVLDAREYPLPKAFDVAYRNSSVLVFEADTTQVDSPETQSMIQNKLLFGKGHGLDKLLKSGTFEELVSFATERRLSMAGINTLKPGIVSSLLTVSELRRLGIEAKSVDEFYTRQARKDQKKTAELESFEEQVDMLSRMGMSDPDVYIRYVLNKLKALPEFYSAFTRAWKKGDHVAMDELAVTPLKNEFPQVYQDMILKRNVSWLPRIQDMLGTSEVEMVLVGAAHLTGDAGVLSLLEAQGYTIEQM